MFAYPPALKRFLSDPGPEFLWKMSRRDEARTRDAKRILNSRPGMFVETLPTKGGPKYFGHSGTSDNGKVSTLLVQHNKTLTAKKVRKLLNLGQAEWIPERGVARITKQAKFMQHMGHHEDFFALYPEEALCLLDIGDIELTLNGVPLSIQESFSFILNNKNTPNYCSLSEYQVFAHFSRHGYIVQRLTHTKENAKSHEEAPSIATHEKLRQVKRKLSDMHGQIEEDQKVSKIDVTGADHALHVGLMDAPFRDWFQFTKTTTAMYPGEISCDSSKHTAVLPNLADRSMSFLKKPSIDLIPSSTSARDYTIEPIWFQRITKDTRAEYKDAHSTYSHPRSFNLSGIHKEIRSWKDYKWATIEYRREKYNENTQLLHKMRSGVIAPLLHPEEAFSLEKTMTKISFPSGVAETRKDSRNKATDHTVKFNVYRTDPAKPFKKTNPGLPFIRVVVIDVNGDVPNLKTIQHINAQSNGVPVKYAVVDCGQVSFLSFDNESIPSLL